MRTALARPSTPSSSNSSRPSPRAPASLSCATTGSARPMPAGAAAPSPLRARGVPRADASTNAATPQVPERRGAAPGQPRYGAWADLMRRGFDLDVLACPRCGGRMRLLATIEDPQVIRQILAHLGLPRGPRPQPTPAPSGSRHCPRCRPACLPARLSACHAQMPPPGPWPVHLEARPIFRRLPPSLVVNVSS